MIAAFLRWLREEVRLLALDSWDGGRYATPATPEPFTAADPRCARTIERLAEARNRMRRLKTGLLDGREVPPNFLARTDLEETFRAIKRVNTPPVQLVKRRSK